MSLSAGIASAAPAEVPSRIASWEIMGILGRGASATIYLGRELFPARDVAIKVYDSQRLNAEDRKTFRSLFLKETLLARRLTHPNITQVYDAAAEDDRSYIVMEYCREGSLERYCTPETLLPPQRVASLLESCCDALSYASAHGVIHRDLKPHNILMTADGEAKVADFGVAFSNLAFDSTRAMVVGSPAYMAPEQIEGKPASMKSDIYSLGIVLYKMLAGKLPFAPDTPAALAARIMLGNLPNPSEARPAPRDAASGPATRDAASGPAPRDAASGPDLPPLLDVVFARATARDPQVRYASWEDFAADLRTVAHPDGEAAHERVAQLRKLPFFHDFGEPALAEAVPMARWFDVRAGSQLIGEGDPGYSFFVLVRGQMRVSRRGTLLAIRGAGECLAETAFLRRSGARRFSTLTAVTDCSVIEIDPDVLWLASPETTRKFHLAFLEAMANRLENAEGALAEMMATKNVTLF